MKTMIKALSLLILLSGILLADGFDIKKGFQTFSFKDKNGRNQATFHSSAPLEDISGMSSDINGTVTFDTENLKNTLTGEIYISTASLKSGIDLRDEHIRSEGWLDAEKYPNISFIIKEVISVKKISGNQLEAKIKGDFTLKGVTKQVEIPVMLTYLEESEETKARFPGDLLSLRAKFFVKLSDYSVKSKIIGQKVADEIEININIVGYNKI
jgi:polyisoprenoid-binding protein YceI